MKNYVRFTLDGFKKKSEQGIKNGHNIFLRTPNPSALTAFTTA